jgi:hypothetical protein
MHHDNLLGVRAGARFRAQVPVGHLADFMHRQAGGNGHALRADVAADGNQRGQAVAAGKRDSPAP